MLTSFYDKETWCAPLAWSAYLTVLSCQAWNSYIYYENIAYIYHQVKIQARSVQSCGYDRILFSYHDFATLRDWILTTESFSTVHGLKFLLA